MPRAARGVHGGYCYHVVNRGNNRATVFHQPVDYRDFVQLMRRAQARIPIEIFAACLMPNHFHLVVRPLRDNDLGRWMHWLLTTHVGRYHKQRSSSGRVWQGRFKEFPIEEDRHFIAVMRYVERNPLRASLVKDACDWQWGSLNWRTAPTSPIRLTKPPVDIPQSWRHYVNEPQTAAELDAIRKCVRRSRPFGTPIWVRTTAKALGLESSLRSRGRPRRKKKGDTPIF